MMAAEMAVIRLTHVADLPSPEELLRKLQDTPVPPMPGGPMGGAGGGMGEGARGWSAPAPAVGTAAIPARGAAGGGPTALLAGEVAEALSRYPTFDHVIELIRTNRDVKLLVEVEIGVRLVAYQPGRIEFTPSDDAPADLAQRLGTKLQSWTGNRWAVIVTGGGTAETIAEKRDAAEIALREEATAHPLVQAVLARFPKAKIAEIRTPEQIAAEVAQEALPEVEDEWDPFEEE